jgi:pilus assembly protein CpaC
MLGQNLNLKPNHLARSWPTALLLIGVAFGPAALAQSPSEPPPIDSNTPIADRDKKPLEFTVDPKRERDLTVFIGVPSDVQLPFFPADAKIQGDFRRTLRVSVDRQTNTLRFEGVREDDKNPVANLLILDGKSNRIYHFRVTVRSSNLTRIAQEIRGLLNDIDGISIKIVNDKVVVDGQVLLPKEVNRIAAVVAQFGEKAASLVTLSPVAQRKIAQMIGEDINNPEVKVRAVNDRFILEGTVADKDERDRAEAIAQMYVPDIVKPDIEKTVNIRKVFVLNLIQIKAGAPREPGKTIQINVHFVELNKDYQRAFRFQWTPTIEDGSSLNVRAESGAPGGVVSQITAVVSNLLPRLNWAKTHGHARILQASTIIVLDGQQGKLQNVTRVPYATLNGQGQPVTNFEDVGLDTGITPQILNQRSENIRMQMAFSMKGLVGVTDRGPIVSQSAVNTTVIVRSGQSAAVGGLISNSTTTDFNKLPKGANENPLISLYASKAFQRKQSQFVVFVTPVIKASASQGSEKIKNKFRLRD